MMGDDMRAALALFADLGIRYVRPNQHRQRGQVETCCGPFIDRLIQKHGLPHATIVLRTIVESEGNGFEVIADVGRRSESRRCTSETRRLYTLVALRACRPLLPSAAPRPQAPLPASNRAGNPRTGWQP
jgi:hypothetical protein